MTANASRIDEATDQHAVQVATDKFDRLLDDWHGRIDELKVQVDLATLDVREDMAKRLEVTENVYLAVRSRLAAASSWRQAWSLTCSARRLFSLG